MDSAQNKSISFEVCYETDKLSKIFISSGLSRNNLKKCYWASLNGAYESNSIGLIYLLNNSLPELKESAKIKDVFKIFHRLLEPKGCLIFDIENINNTNQVILPPNDNGIKRFRKDHHNNQEKYYVALKIQF